MTSPLRVLHLEDDVRDTELVQAALEAEGITVSLERVETEREFVAKLSPETCDLILADYTLPSYDGLSALRIAQQQLPGVPFIFVSGTLGEEVAIEALKTGATDYVLKTRLGRLAPSVTRALREAEERRERQRAQAALRDSEEQWKAAFECNPVMYFMVDRAGITLSVNNRGAEQLGYDFRELVGQPVLNIFHPDDREFVRCKAEECFQNLAQTIVWEARKVRANGTIMWVRETANALSLKNKPVLLVVCEDITDRKRAEEALRTSEELARSHVDVMMRSLDALAQKAASEKVISEILRTIGQHLRAVRVLLWMRNLEDDSFHLPVVIEHDQEVTPDPESPAVKDPQFWNNTKVWEQMFFTKSPVVIDDIEHDSRITPEFQNYLTSKGCRKFLAIPLLVSGELRGFIAIQHAEKGAYGSNEIELAQALAHHVMLATHSQELVQQQRAAAILKERTRMARDVHDTLAQGFTGVIMQMEAAEEALLEEDPEHAVSHVRSAREVARESLGEARRSVHALRPQALEKATFPEALKAIIQNTTAGTSLRTEFQIDGEPCALAAGIEEHLLHIGQEALSNALKHACAKRFETRIAFEPHGVRLELCDDGAGFILGQANGGIGLLGMRERVEQIGGTLSVSSAPGEGTRIVAVAPYKQEVAA
jgi:PAS domain S-box-containing protein